MADYYSHNDPRRKQGDQYLDYNTGSSGWVWGGILAVAVIALIMLGLFAGGDGATGVESAAPAAAETPAAIAPATDGAAVPATE